MYKQTIGESVLLRSTRNIYDVPYIRAWFNETFTMDISIFSVFVFVSRASRTLSMLLGLVAACDIYKKKLKFFSMLMCRENLSRMLLNNTCTSKTSPVIEFFFLAVAETEILRNK